MITDFRINAKGELEGKVIPPAKWEEMYTKDDMVAMLTELKSEMNPIKECEQQIYGKENWNFVRKCQDVIQEKINALRGEKNERGTQETT